MFKTIVASVILFLFVLQVNNSLFANENEEATAGAIAEENPATSNIENSDQTLMRAMMEAESAVEESVTTEAKEETNTEISAEVVVEKAIEATTEEVTPANAVAETVSEENAVAVVEKESDVIATVNGEKILRLSFDKRLNVFRRMNQEVTDAVKMQVVNQLTKKILLKQFVEKQDVRENA